MHYDGALSGDRGREGASHDVPPPLTLPLRRLPLVSVYAFEKWRAREMKLGTATSLLFLRISEELDPASDASRARGCSSEVPQDGCQLTTSTKSSLLVPGRR